MIIGDRYSLASFSCSLFSILNLIPLESFISRFIHKAALSLPTVGASVPDMIGPTSISPPRSCQSAVNVNVEFVNSPAFVILICY